ncbi:hypothetical protein [Gilliamella sp. ESL0254]|uniref:hypothetical protein n=1 Tax=Gilliamella sp. ESL0254 TaxID=2705035 RepID=UPI00158051A9|nr:hypothetical protein [Gilliamella sp. ESL0254]NUF27352.1 hypothetical protein [Gilliamella sp. ESL0254]
MASGIWHLACQTYALNLFQYYRSLKQTQSLLLSSKLSRLTSSLRLLARLLPNPRYLSFLSKLFKSPLVFASLLLLSYSQKSQALSTQTTKVIEGSAPYLTLDGGRTKVISADSLLTIELPDGSSISPSTNTSSPTNPIKLVNGSTFNDIHMLVPSGANTVNLSNLITQGNWGDDDGDGQGANGVTASGNILVNFTDRDGNTVSRSDSLSICSAPYKVTLSNTDGYLQTQYGVPNISSFSGQTVTYYINPDSVVRVCYARPNLYFGGTGAIMYGLNDDSHFAGPSNIWSSTKGFVNQSTSSSSYDRNFPTTGADGLYFDLELPVGVDGSQLTWSSITRSGITATVSWIRPNQSNYYDIWIRDKSQYVTRVTLRGPRADSTQIQSDNPSPLTPLPSLPQTFELVGRDSRGNEVRYGFVLQKWFVNRGNNTGNPSEQMSWCSRLGYRLAKVKDLTNAVCSGLNVDPNYPCTGAIGATPSSSVDRYKRHIGAGFFTEWGVMYNYADVGFIDYNYWTSDVSGSNSFYVYSVSGFVGSSSLSFNYYAVCTVP